MPFVDIADQLYADLISPIEDRMMGAVAGIVQAQAVLLTLLTLIIPLSAFLLPGCSDARTPQHAFEEYLLHL